MSEILHNPAEPVEPAADEPKLVSMSHDRNNVQCGMNDMLPTAFRLYLPKQLHLGPDVLAYFCPRCYDYVEWVVPYASITQRLMERGVDVHIYSHHYYPIGEDEATNTIVDILQMGCVPEEWLREEGL